MSEHLVKTKDVENHLRKLQKKGEEEHFCRCGICDKNFNSNEEWNEHAQTSEHKVKVFTLEKMMALARYKGEHYDMRGFVRKIQEQSKMKETISDIYAILECYDMGSLSQQIYTKACRDALKYFEKKYGKDNFWFRELFLHMQSNYWENTQRVRSLLHAEVIGCPHTIIEQCEKEMSEIELKHLKGRKCQHCTYIEGVKEKWDKK